MVVAEVVRVEEETECYLDLRPVVEVKLVQD